MGASAHSTQQLVVFFEDNQKKNIFPRALSISISM
jgi:hypothetical protein